MTSIIKHEYFLLQQVEFELSIPVVVHVVVVEIDVDTGRLSSFNRQIELLFKEYLF